MGTLVVLVVLVLDWFRSSIGLEFELLLFPWVIALANTASETASQSNGVTTSVRVINRTPTQRSLSKL